jgi:hypothetical protein
MTNLLGLGSLIFFAAQGIALDGAIAIFELIFDRRDAAKHACDIIATFMPF